MNGPPMEIGEWRWEPTYSAAAAIREWTGERWRLVAYVGPTAHDSGGKRRSLGEADAQRIVTLHEAARRGDVDIEYFRYARDDRLGWPESLVRGTTWPWEASA